MEKSDYVRLESSGRRHIRFVSKYRLSAQTDEIKRFKPLLPKESSDLLVDNDYGFIDKLQYRDAFSLAAYMGHGICRLEDFVEFLQSLRSGKAIDGNGKKLSKKESDSILEDILAKKDSFNGKYTIHGERFANRLIESDGKVILVSYGANGSGPKEVFEEVAEYVKERRVNSSFFNAQGFPTKKGKDWNFFYPGSVSKLSGGSKEHSPLEFATNESGTNMLIGSYLGVNGIYNGLGFRLLTYPALADLKLKRSSKLN